MSSRKVFSGNRIFLPDASGPIPATIIVDILTGKITDVQPNIRRNKADFPDIVNPADFVDAGNKLVIPGIVDAHVHLNEPGRTEWEGFYTGTRAAASGGITTVIDMPLNSIPPTTTVANLEEKRRAARDQCWTDVGFWGGVIPGNQRDLKPLLDAGVKGFKCFLIESGVEEFPCVNERDVVEAMNELRETPTVLCFHAELEDSSLTPPTPPTPPATPPDSTLYSTFLASRPPSLELSAIQLITRLHARYPSLRLHIVHLSTSSALPLIKASKLLRLPLTVETCFHYLTLSSPSPPSSAPSPDLSSIPHSRCTQFKCCPPIRSSENQSELWEGLEEGLIDFIVSDHSPCTPELKKMEEGDMMGAWGGISTLGLGLSLLWTEGKKRFSSPKAKGDEKKGEKQKEVEAEAVTNANAREQKEGELLRKVVKWLCVETARHVGLQDLKGKLAVGFDADLVIWDPDREFKVTKESLNFKNKVTPYEGLTLSGVVEQTYLRGNLVYDHLKGFSQDPFGKLL